MFVWSSANAGAAAAARTKKLDRARDDLAALTRGLGGRHYPTVDEVQARLTTIFDALARLRLIPATANAPPIVPAPTGLQARILELLDVDPITTR